MMRGALIGFAFGVPMKVLYEVMCKMRVLLQIGAGRWPGYFEMCLAIVEKLRGNGHDVVVWCSVPVTTEWFRANTEENIRDVCTIPLGYEGSAKCFSEIAESLDGYIDLSRMISLYVDLIQPSGGLSGCQDVAIPWVMEVVRLFAEHPPDVVVLWNPFHPHAFVARSICDKAGIPVLFSEKGLLPYSMQIDSCGINADSSIARESIPLVHDRHVVYRDIEKLRLDVFGGGVTGWPQKADAVGGYSLRQRLGISRDSRIVLYIGQVNSDSNLILFSPHFRSNVEAIRFMLERLPKDEEWYFLGKRHPFGCDDDSSIREVIGDHGAWLDDIHLHDALEIADAVVSINSSVVFESLLLMKPTILLGRGIFSGKSVAFEYDGHNKSDLTCFLQRQEPMGEADQTMYWCWRTACQWLYKVSAKDIPCESMRAVLQIEKMAANGFVQHHKLTEVIWTFVRASLDAALYWSRKYDLVTEESAVLWRRLNTIESKPIIKMYRCVKRLLKGCLRTNCDVNNGSGNQVIKPIGKHKP